jgi:hypothetical protein
LLASGAALRVVGILSLQNIWQGGVSEMQQMCTVRCALGGLHTVVCSFTDGGPKCMLACRHDACEGSRLHARRVAHIGVHMQHVFGRSDV